MIFEKQQAFVFHVYQDNDDDTCSKLVLVVLATSLKAARARLVKEFGYHLGDCELKNMRPFEKKAA